MLSAPPPQSRALLLFPHVLGGEGRLPGSQWALSRSRAPAADGFPTRSCGALSAAHGAWSAGRQRRPRPRHAPRATPEALGSRLPHFGSDSDESRKCSLAAAAHPHRNAGSVLPSSASESRSSCRLRFRHRGGTEVRPWRWSAGGGRSPAWCLRKSRRWGRAGIPLPQGWRGGQGGPGVGRPR